LPGAARCDWFHRITAHDEKGARRLDDPTDFVRLELEAGLARAMQVIPILVDGASVPKASESQRVFNRW
jgi:hypothetical protein